MRRSRRRAQDRTSATKKRGLHRHYRHGRWVPAKRHGVAKAAAAGTVLGGCLPATARAASSLACVEAAPEWKTGSERYVPESARPRRQLMRDKGEAVQASACAP
jgi:hypothetical protein